MTKEEILKLIESEANGECFVYKGRKCEIIRNRFMTFWCGYAFKKHVYNYNDLMINVHGGVTWNSWGKIGFDCGHYLDYVIYPEIELKGGLSFPKELLIGGEIYRNKEYVIEQVKQMADQMTIQEKIQDKINGEIALEKAKAFVYNNRKVNRKAIKRYLLN